jgi:HAD superfamily hydrolase (TIGR01549 family)
MTNKIRAVLFDWDLTLGRPLGDVSFEDRISEQLTRGGYPHTSQEVRQAILTRNQLIEDGSIVGKVRPQTDDELVAFYKQILFLLGHRHIEHEVAEELRQSYADLPFILYDDSLPTLETLTQRGIRIGVVTNHSPRIRKAIVDRVGSFVPESAITISGEIDIYKPDEEIFKIGAQSVATSVNACMYVGDDLIVDVIAALNAGYKKALWLNRSGNSILPDLPPNAVEISTVSEVIGKL